MQSDIRQTILFMSISGIAAALIAAVLFLCYILIKPGILMYGPVYSTMLLQAVVYICIVGNSILYVGMLVYLYIPGMTTRNGYSIYVQYLSHIYPVTKWLGYIVRQSSSITHSYIVTRNAMILKQCQQFCPKDILVLAPHCLQWDQCPHKITRNVSNCRQCGHCPVGTIWKLTQSYRVHFVVATGGTLARQLIQQCAPKLVIAIACERDLISGMNDTAPLPVLGLFNERPNGPCFNTNVNISALHSLLDTMIGEPS